MCCPLFLLTNLLTKKKKYVNIKVINFYRGYLYEMYSMRVPIFCLTAFAVRIVAQELLK